MAKPSVEHQHGLHHIPPEHEIPLVLYNTRTREKQVFEPINPDEVGFYSCGITAYSTPHIGNMRAYIFADTLKRVLYYFDYPVKHVENVTDVGHLTSDADTGDDKLQKAARQQKTTAWEISRIYTEEFLDFCDRLNILPTDVLCKATDYIQEQIDLVLELEKKGFTYQTSDGIYYDTSKFPRYPNFAQLDIEGLRAGERVDMGEKKNPTDFALWKFSPEDEQRDMEWDSPWGKGFPGWHIECSAMSMAHLGNQFDIHTGGVDHINVHHTNEIAQAEGATGLEPVVNFWMHSEFLTQPTQDGTEQKMSKSKGGIVDIAEFAEQWGDALIFRYFVLGAKYSKKLPISDDAFKSAQSSYNKLKSEIKKLSDEVEGDVSLHTSLDPEAKQYLQNFREAVGDDLNTPVALAVLWTMLKDEVIPTNQKLTLIMDFDTVLGLDLLVFKEEQVEIPEDVVTLAEKRQVAKEAKNWDEADRLRDEISSRGFIVQDKKGGFEILPASD